MSEKPSEWIARRAALIAQERSGGLMHVMSHDTDILRAVIGYLDSQHEAKQPLHEPELPYER